MTLQLLFFANISIFSGAKEGGPCYCFSAALSGIVTVTTVPPP